VLHVGWPVAECGDRVLDELLLLIEGQRPVVAALEADRRGRLQIDARAPTERAAEVSGPHLDLVGKGQQPLV
jgi:hypothetical protein